MEVKDALISEEALRQFTDAWLQCTLPLPSWTHAAHILVAASLVVTRDEDGARETMRLGIPRYNVATGGANTADSGYHETLTCFWVAKISAYLRRQHAPEVTDDSPLERVRRAVAHFGERRDWFSDHYSFNVVKSREARAVWVPPDLRPID
jgi:hypothetical protein